MAEYELDEYEEYEDYEDENGEYEEGDEYEEEEERLPTQEEIEYLELRQRLKETIRKKVKKKDSSSGLSSSREKKKNMPYDNFGSFFGPSQPVIAQRVIQESKSLLENPHLAERVIKPKNVDPNKGGSSTQSNISKPRPNGQQPRSADNYAKPKAKIQMIKNTRDYSFLLSDDAELPIPPKNPTPKSAPPPKREVHSSQRQQPQQQNNNGRKIINSREERRPVPTSSLPRPKSDPQSQRKSQSQSQRPSTSTKLTSSTSSLDSRKQVGRNDGRPTGHKPLPSKTPAVNRQKPIPPPVSRSSVPNRHKPVPARSAPAVVHKRPVEQQRRDDRGPSKGNMVRKPVVTSKPQIKQQTARPPPPQPNLHQKKPQLKRPSRPFDDDDDDDKAIGMIRSMFRYNPNRYHNDDDDSDMEAGFDDIMAEEHRSARIAAQEDEEERIKIEAEERREKERREKRRKLNNR